MQRHRKGSTGFKLLACWVYFVVNLAAAQPPANDAMANATILQGASIDFTGNTYGGTFEAGDPMLDGQPFNPSVSYGAGSVWFRWTSDITGFAVLSVDEAPAPSNRGLRHFVSVFQGVDVTGLRSQQNYARLDVLPKRYALFPIVAGQTYSLEYVEDNEIDRSQQFHLQAQESPIIQQPQSQTVLPGDSCVFAVLAAQYGVHGKVQWQRNGIDIPGAINPTFQIDNISAASAGEYRARVSVAETTYQSQIATLTLTKKDIMPLLRLRYVPGSDNEFKLEVYPYGESNQRYRILHSPDFSFNYEFAATEGEFTWRPENPNSGFVMAVRDGDLKQACVALRKRIDFAKEAWKIQNHKVEGSAIVQGEVNQFLDGVPSKPIRRCLLGGLITYHNIGTFPVCTIETHNH